MVLHVEWLYAQCNKYSKCARHQLAFADLRLVSSSHFNISAIHSTAISFSKHIVYLS